MDFFSDLEPSPCFPIKAKVAGTNNPDEVKFQAYTIHFQEMGGTKFLSPCPFVPLAK